MGKRERGGEVYERTGLERGMVPGYNTWAGSQHLSWATWPQSRLLRFVLPISVVQIQVVSFGLLPHFPQEEESIPLAQVALQPTAIPDPGLDMG